MEFAMGFILLSRGSLVPLIILS